MKYVFKEEKAYGQYSLRMYLEDVPTLNGNVLALEDLFYGEIGDGLWFIEQVDEVLNGEKELIEGGGDIFNYVIDKKTSKFKYIFKNRLGGFAISTEVLYEIAITWHRRITEFNEKYKKKHFWRRK